MAPLSLNNMQRVCVVSVVHGCDRPIPLEPSVRGNDVLGKSAMDACSQSR